MMGVRSDRETRLGKCPVWLCPPVPERHLQLEHYLSKAPSGTKVVEMPSFTKRLVRSMEGTALVMVLNTDIHIAFTKDYNSESPSFEVRVH